MACSNRSWSCSQCLSHKRVYLSNTLLFSFHPFKPNSPSQSDFRDRANNTFPIRYKYPSTIYEYKAKRCTNNQAASLQNFTCDRFLSSSAHADNRAKTDWISRSGYVCVRKFERPLDDCSALHVKFSRNNFTETELPRALAYNGWVHTTPRQNLQEAYDTGPTISFTTAHLARQHVLDFGSGDLISCPWPHV